MREIHLYPDGSCLENGLPSARGGWGLPVIEGGELVDKILEDNKVVKCLQGGTVIEENIGKLRTGKQTNNRAEMEAFLQALIWVDSHDTSDMTITIHCDSEIVVKGVHGHSKRDANRDIWEQIEKMCTKLLGKFFLFHCEGHVDEYNILADKLAKQAANSLMLAPTVVNI